MRPLTGEDSPLLGTRKASHVFEPLGEDRNLVDSNVALTQT